MSAAVERLLATALAEVGYHEKAGNADLDSKTGNSGSRNYTKYARDLDALGDVYNGKKQGYDWCDVFVDWCFIKTFGETLGVKLMCQPYQGCGAGCNWSAGYYKNMGQFHKAGPQPGDQIFYDWDLDGEADHTGIVTAVQGGKVYTVEGNTSDPSNPGDVVVAEKRRDLDYRYIYGYGRPDWSFVPEPTPTPTPGGDDDMTGEEIYNKLMEYIAAKPVPDWAVRDGEFQRAVELGITDGTRPCALASRLETAVMALRAAEKV